MHHTTLNTGHTRVSPRAEVGPEAIAACRALVADEGGTLFGTFVVQITRHAGGAVFSVSRAGQPILFAAVAWTPEGEAHVWPEIERLYLRLSDQAPQFYAPAVEPVKPPGLPWLGVLLLPPIALQSRADIGWLGDFERCLAWTLIESHP